MRAATALLLAGVLGATPALAAPLVPRIDSHDFLFGAHEPADVPLYDPRGVGPDWLTLLADDTDREVFTFWEIWPGGPPYAIYNAADQLGGDLELYLEFDGEDALPPHLEVSLTGRGRNAGADLIISGKIPELGISDYGALVAIDVRQASLYGYGGQSSFVLETAGVFSFVNPLLPGAEELLGASAVSRGNLDYFELILPTGYDPLVDYGLSADGGGYSGEAGHGHPTPEPAPALLLLVGAGLTLRRRPRRQ